MNKKLISKCCGAGLGHALGDTSNRSFCVKCKMNCEVIEEPIPQPIQKEEVNSFLKECDNLVESIDGVETPTPSDTFIDEKMKEFRENIFEVSKIRPLGKEYPYRLQKEAKDWIEDFLKSSLQEQKGVLLKDLLVALQKRKVSVIFKGSDWNEKGRRTGNWELGYDDAEFDAEQIIKSLLK